jgi:hypothetical protein
MMAIKAKINHQKNNAREIGIKMIPDGKMELHMTTTVREGVKMGLVMELTKEMELLTLNQTILDLKMRLSMVHIILTKTIRSKDIIKNMIEMKHLIRTKLYVTTTTIVTESEM